MLSTSFAYRRHVAGGGKVALKATLTMADGTVHSLTGEDFTIGGFSLSESSSSAESFDVGAAVMGTSEVTLANYDLRWDDADFTGAEIVVYVGVEFEDDTTEWLRRGTYLVEQPDSYTSTIKLSCHDNMRLFERDYSEVSTAYPATLLTIVTDICDACDVTMASADFPRSSYVVTARPSSDATSCLDVISWAAQVACCFASVDEYGRLRLKWYDTAAYESEDWLDGGSLTTTTTPYSDGDTADGGIFHSGGDDVNGGNFTTNRWAAVTAIGSMTKATDDVVITGVRVTASDYRNSDGTQGLAGETALYGTEGYVLEISKNPLVEYGKASDVAAIVGPVCVGMFFRPLTVAAIGDPAWEAGDPMVVTDGFQRTYRSWATQIKWKAQGYENMSCGAQTPSRNTAATYSAQTRTDVQARNTRRAEYTARALAISNLQRELADSSGLYETTEQQQDGSYIYYYHDKPTLAESQVIWRFAANAFAFSNDGGETYPYGVDVTGAAILDRIYAIGIDAQYVNAGRVAFEGGGFIDFETGTMGLGDSAGFGSGTVSDALAAIDDARRYATDYLTYANGELTLGRSDSAIKNVMTNSRQSFRTDAGDVAWFGLNADDIWEMFIETASVQNRLSFNDFSWIARSNGNMTLKWMG